MVRVEIVMHQTDNKGAQTRLKLNDRNDYHPDFLRC